MLTRDEILAVVAQGPEAVLALVETLQSHHAAALATLQARVKTLEDRLNQDSHNSHQPPSSDKPARKRTHSQRKRSGKPSGGQAGHPGQTLVQVAEPDHIMTHTPETCGGCGQALDAVPVSACERRQVFDLPKPRLEVTEHQARTKICPACATATSGAFPAAVTQPVQYGPRVKAIGVYLQTYQLLPSERTAEALHDLFGVALSEGTLDTSQTTAYTALAPVETAIGEALKKADVVHVDETGIRVENHLAWVHVLSTTQLTFYAWHRKRGGEALRAIGLVLLLLGRRVHDAWATYLTLPGLYALCNAHLLRELTAIAEQTGQTWASRLAQLLRNMKAAVETAQAAGQTALGPRQLAGYEAAFSRLIAEGQRAHPAAPATGQRGRVKQSPAYNLLARLVTHRVAVLAFLHDFRVPFDNNQAERDLRMLKVKLKVSGCFRSPHGAARFCRIRGYISTLRKQKLPILDGLTSLFAGTPLMPQL